MHGVSILVTEPDMLALAPGAVSVLSPLGVALLGRREGDEIEYRVPGDTRRLVVKQVLYQPERASFQRETVPFRP
jgi:regulator of nucleoside diphosphate kinase